MNPFRLRTKLVLFALSLALPVSCVLILFYSRDQARAIDRQLERSAENNSKRLRTLLNTELRLLQRSAALVARLAEVRRLCQRGLAPTPVERATIAPGSGPGELLVVPAVQVAHDSAWQGRDFRFLRTQVRRTWRSTLPCSGIAGNRGTLSLFALHPVTAAVPRAGGSPLGVVGLRLELDQALIDRWQDLLKCHVLLFQGRQCRVSTVFTRDGFARYTDITLPAALYRKKLQRPENYVEYSTRWLGFGYTVCVSGLLDSEERQLGALATALPRYRMAQPWRENLERALLILFVFTLCTLGAAFVAARYLVRTFQGIAGLALEIAHGHLDSRIGPAPRDEIGDMVRSINMMAESLQASLQRRRGTQQRLERCLSHLEKLREDVRSRASQALAHIHQGKDDLATGHGGREEPRRTRDEDAWVRSVRTRLEQILSLVREESDREEIIPAGFEDLRPEPGHTLRAALFAPSLNVKEKLRAALHACRWQEVKAHSPQVASGADAIIIAAAWKGWTPLRMLQEKRTNPALAALPVLFVEEQGGRFISGGRSLEHLLTRLAREKWLETHTAADLEGRPPTETE